jgi:hypothetical protein
VIATKIELAQVGSLYLNPAKITHAEPALPGSSREGVDVYFEGGSKRTLTNKEWSTLCDTAFHLNATAPDSEPGETAPVAMSGSRSWSESEVLP